MAESAQKSIRFDFHLFGRDRGEHVVTKEVGGVKRRYIRGISSGILRDGDGERMTMDAIKSMHSQAQAGDVLLYHGKHGVNFADDIGILTDSDIVNKQDWFTEYRLYDETDGMGPATLEAADKVWRQVTGEKPYVRPREYGFSIEGIIPDGGILSMQKNEDGSYGNRVIGQIELQGVVLVSKPSYANVATAVYKALGELPPGNADRIRKGFEETFTEQLESQEARDNYYRRYFQMQNALEEQIEQIMRRGDGRERQRLEILFSEFGPAMTNLILQHEGAFQQADAEAGEVKLEKDQAAKLVEEIVFKTNTIVRNIQTRLGGQNGKH